MSNGGQLRGLGRVGVAAIAALAMAGVSAASAQDQLRIGALMPLTGGLQAYGETSLNGVRLAIEEANAAGGVLGSEVELIVGDTQTMPQPAVDAAQRMISVAGVHAIVGALSSGNTIPVAQSITSENRIPQISNASTAPAITTLDDDDFLFRTTPSDAFQGVALSQIVNEQGVGSVAILYVNNDYGQGLADAFEAAFTGNGGEVTGSSAFEPDQASYRGELSNLAGTGAEALVLIAYPDDGGITIMRQSLEEGFFESFILTDGMKSERVVEQLGAENLEGFYGSSPRSVESEAADRFTELYEERFGELPPQPFIDGAYDAAMILMLAAEKAGSTDGTAIRDAIREVSNAPGEEILPGDFARAKELIAAGEDINYQGAAGEHEFDEYGDVSGTFEHWVIRDGRLVTERVFDPAS
jgi:branched-chain amino acid transport system substrate-binding protein